MAESVSDSIVLTGCGWVTPFAVGSIPTVLAAAPRAGREPTATAPYWAVPEEWLDDCPDLSKELRSDKGAWMTAVALEHAHRQAGLEPDSVAPERVGMALGCALAGQLGMISFANEVRQQSARFVSPIHFPQTVGNYIAGALARSYDIRGPNTTLSSGVASGLDALIQGCRLLLGGGADVVYAGGTECVSEALALGLAEPGVVLSEGACLFVLERAEDAGRRGAPPLATITNTSHLVAGAPAVPETGDNVVSGAGVRQPGAILIEHWIGRCFAALGTAAAAAGIAAAAGLEVPLADATAGDSVSVGRITVPAPARIMVIADADGAHLSTLQLEVVPSR